LSSADFQAHLSHSESTTKNKKWSLTQQAFDKLLSAFSEDRDKAGNDYEVARRKLLRFFEWRAVESPDEYVDETLNRVARRIDEGQKIDNLMAYIAAVARLVLMEVVKARPRSQFSLDDPENKVQLAKPESVEPDARLECLDRCLESLPEESRTLIIDYYQEERRVKIELRQELADRLQIPLNALRIRAHRIRIGLEKCITNCLQLEASAK
jgi:DNA-directed RNA polymerase specialized sigma24 family protein